MNIKRIAKLSAAVTLGLSLMAASLAADAASARSAAAHAQTGSSSHPSGEVTNLGTITVTAADTLEARHSAQIAAQPGTVFLGTVQVSGRDTKPAFVGKTVLALRRLGHNAMISMITALAFVRVGG